ncbi:uncharacterized protein ACNLHF_018269 isoform 2-T3 [Anomaloglossus baeobatrachus]|uniref:uncharacterized protein LOC142311168 isoform X2 n=1 Tax=Anomaloglossus baeobatrachus TaxID=238106 RepID=UPI003F5054F8
MMSKPNMFPVNGFMVPPNGPPAPPNSIPYQFQSNMMPRQNGPNEYSTIPPWNAKHVGPQSIPSMTTQQWSAQPGVTVQCNPNYMIPPLSSPTSWVQAFEKGKPKALGILLIIAAICQIGLGILLPFTIYTSVTVYSGNVYWGPIFVKASFGLNIVSSICSLCGIIINAVDYAAIYCENYYGCFYFNPVPVYVIQNVVPMSPAGYPPNTSQFPLQPNVYTQK